jgi:hypothetical protein
LEILNTKKTKRDTLPRKTQHANSSQLTTGG